MIHEHALGVVKRGLRELGMIRGRQLEVVRQRRSIATRNRAHLRGSEAVNRG